MCLQETKIQEMTIGIVWSLGVGRCLEWGGGVWVVRGVVFWDNRCYSWRSWRRGTFQSLVVSRIVRMVSIGALQGFMDSR